MVEYIEGSYRFANNFTKINTLIENSLDEKDEGIATPVARKAT